jgi:hypothetical protein
VPCTRRSGALGREPVADPGPDCRVSQSDDRPVAVGAHALFSLPLSVATGIGGKAGDTSLKIAMVLNTTARRSRSTTTSRRRELLLHKPGEPFGALDALTRARLQLQLVELWQSESKTETVLMVTHGIEEAIFLADRIIVMSGPPGPSVLDRSGPGSVITGRTSARCPRRRSSGPDTRGAGRAAPTAPPRGRSRTG